MTFSDSVAEYRKQLGRGHIQQAYRGLMKFMGDLQTYFGKKYPDLDASASLYPGYMDMTYFAIVPPLLKSRKLKIAIVFVHQTTSFEVWLAGANRQAQAKYWGLFKDQDWGEYRVTPPGKGVDSILAYEVAGKPDFNNLEALTKHLAEGTVKFISDIEKFLST